MEKGDVEMLVEAMNEHDIKYLIVGGLAVTAHGYVRFTADVDLVLVMQEENLRKAVELFKSLGYLPRSPVRMEEYTEAAKRAQWKNEKGMVVFSLFSPKHPATEIDLFIEPPLEVDKAMLRAKKMEIGRGVMAMFCSLEDLIEMKLLAGRSNDLEDVKRLREIHGND